MKIADNPLVFRQSQSQLQLERSSADAPAGGGAGEAADLAPGVTVSLSSQGVERSGGGGSDDVEESDLPQGIQVLIRMIRELRLQISECQAELQALQQSADGMEALEQVEALMMQVTSLQGALTTAMGSLAKAMQEVQMDDRQRLAAIRLAMG